MKTLDLTKTHANILLLNLENNKKKPINRTQRRRMKVIYEAFDDVIDSFVATKDGLVEECRKKMDAVATNIDIPAGEKSLQITAIDRDYGQQLKEFNETEGEGEVSIALEDGDFQIVSDIWKAQDGFSSGRKEAAIADAIDDAFDAALAPADKT